MIAVPVLALLLGFLLFYFAGAKVSPAYADYVSVAIVAGLDAILGGIRSRLERRYNELIFISGFFVNMALAALLAFIGDRLGVPLYLAAVIALGVSIYQNLGRIRGLLVTHEIERRHPTVVR